jgi:CheY-like chemotaxis protein
VANAYDAMEGGGTLTIHTENYYLDELAGGYENIPKGEYVKLTLADTGKGIPSKIVSKIFDPFFTTKATDKRRGSGLGLSVVHAVMEDHHGYIDLETKPERGTKFYLYFPVTRQEIESSQGDQIYGGEETIMVVDDDAEQRDVTVKLLEKLGYSVLTADSGEDAIQRIKENAIDLILMDMIMPPGIDGADTYKKILDFRPNQKAIIVSGFARSERAKYALDLGASGFLRKPVTLKSLAQAIRKALDKEIPSTGQQSNYLVDIDENRYFRRTSQLSKLHDLTPLLRRRFVRSYEFILRNEHHSSISIIVIIMLPTS